MSSPPPYPPPLKLESDEYTTVFGDAMVYVVIFLGVIFGLIFAFYQYFQVDLIKVAKRKVGIAGSNADYLLEDDAHSEEIFAKRCADIQAAITEGSTSFLFTEYYYIGWFIFFFSFTLYFLLASSDDSWNSDWTTYDVVSDYPDAYWSGREKAPAGRVALCSTCAFIVGALTSLLSGYYGMKIATFANARTTLEARKGIAQSYILAFRAGNVMGFTLTSLGVLNLFLLFLVFKAHFKSDWRSLFESLAGYGLGGSSIALFGRVGGGIYTKAADVGADLVGKVEKGIPEDDPRNPAVIADNVGDNVGDIAGMGSDLFGSLAEATCAALVLSSATPLGTSENLVAMMYPLMLSATSIVVCMATAYVGINLKPPRKMDHVEKSLKNQLIIATGVMLLASYMLTVGALPYELVGLNIDADGNPKQVRNYEVWYCVALGLCTGLAIGLVTEYYTSNTYTPVKELAESCKTGAATNVIFGLALGYRSTVVPILGIATNIFVCYQLADFYGIAMAALGMLGTLATALAIDAYGPISDNAGGIAEMAGMGEEVRERTDCLDAAGNTTAAIGKGFAIGSAALVSLALLGSFIQSADLSLDDLSLSNNRVFSGLIVGAMLPYWFSAMLMKSVGVAALAMVEEVRHQFANIHGLLEGTAKADYKRCVEISTTSSLQEMLAPGALVMLTPLVVGCFCGTQCLAGLLAGALVSGVQLAISSSNSGGAWDNAKKFIEAGKDEVAQDIGGKGSAAHTAAVIGDTVGDPLKDTSGPALNILIKLMAVESLVLAPFFREKTGKGGEIFGSFDD